MNLKPNMEKLDEGMGNTKEFIARKNVAEKASQELYSPTSSPLLWSSELYVDELMRMSRLNVLETKGMYKDNRFKIVTEENYRLEKDNKMLQEQISNLQVNMERGQQELVTLK